MGERRTERLFERVLENQVEIMKTLWHLPSIGSAQKLSIERAIGDTSRDLTVLRTECWGGREVPLE